jgi:O-antigen ligase
MIGSIAAERRWTPAGSATAPRVPWLLLGPVLAGIALIPLLKPNGPGNTSVPDVPIALGILIALIWAGFTGQDLRLPYALAVGFIMLGGAVAAIASPLPGNGLLAVTQDLFLLAWCGVIVNVARQVDAFKWLMRAWVASAVAWALILIFAVATGNDALAGITDRTGVRASLTFGDPNYAASYFFVAFMMVMAAHLPRRRILRLGVYAVLLAALALTGSNGGILSCAVGTAVVMVGFAARRWGRTQLLALLCIAGVIGIVGLMVVQTLPIEDWANATGVPLLRDSVGRSSQSAQERAWLIEETLGLFSQGAPWGVGPNATKPLLQSQLAPYAYQTHDDYIEAIVERGVLGAIGLLLLIGSLVIRTWTMATTPMRREFAAIFPNRAPMVGAALGLAVSASYYQILHFRHVWTFFAVIAALYLWGRE